MRNREPHHDCYYHVCQLELLDGKGRRWFNKRAACNFALVCCFSKLAGREKKDEGRECEC